MGNRFSAKVKEELSSANVRIAQSTENFLDFVDNTASHCEAEVEDLIEIINDILVEFKSKEIIKELGKSVEPLENELERHSNYQKHSVRLLLDYIAKAHDDFLQIYATILDIACSATTNSDTPTLFDSSILFKSTRSYCESQITAYESDLKLDSSFPPRLLFNRVSRFREILVRYSQRLLNEVVSTAILNKKELIMDSIDETIRCALKSNNTTTNTNTNTNTDINTHTKDKDNNNITVKKWKEIIDEIVEISDEEIINLAHFPILNPIFIDHACRDIQTYVRNIIRTIQISYSTHMNTNEQLLYLMNNKLDVMIDGYEALEQKSSEALVDIDVVIKQDNKSILRNYDEFNAYHANIVHQHLHTQDIHIDTNIKTTDHHIHMKQNGRKRKSTLPSIIESHEFDDIDLHVPVHVNNDDNDNHNDEGKIPAVITTTLSSSSTTATTTTIPLSEVVDKPKSTRGRKSKATKNLDMIPDDTSSVNTSTTNGSKRKRRNQVD